MEQEREQAFIDAVREGKHRMYRVALGYLHSPQDAEDAVSEAVEATWKKLKHIRDPEALPAYLMRSVINAAHDELRRRKRTVPILLCRQLPARHTHIVPPSGTTRGSSNAVPARWN